MEELAKKLGYNEDAQVMAVKSVLPRDVYGICMTYKKLKASKTVDKDKIRCHYCNEFGHFIRECSKKKRDENKTGHFNGMSMDYYEDDLYTGEDYDDDVFATLNH